MQIIIKLMALLFCCMWSLPLGAETLYLWTDENGKMHITEEAPADSSRIIDTMVYQPQPVPDVTAAPESRGKQKKDLQRDEKCRIAVKARRIAAEAQKIAMAAQARAEKKRKQAQDQKERVGYDDELLDDYKDDIRELQSTARQAELFAEQAKIQAEKADLRARRIELEAAPDCRF